MKPLKILFVVTEDWYFCSHRLPLAVAAVRAGYEVAVVTRITDRRKAIEEAGIRVIPLRHLRRSSLNPFREFAAITELSAIFRRERPNLVHQVALKPALYGSLVANLIGIRAKVNALGGLGFIFSSNRLLARLIRPFLLWLFRLIFNGKNGQLILQNDDDFSLVTTRAGVDRQRVRLIRSAGVDLEHYVAKEIPSGVPVVMLASRMLWDKGVGEFVSAARLLHEQGIDARFVLVGEPDPDNPFSVALEQLQQWSDSGVVEWWGHRDDMPEVLSQAWVVCLPSYYGEGVPKVLIEAMACARAVVTTDMPGCRDVVRSGNNGLLVKPRDVDDLASALKTFLLDRMRCIALGSAGRQIAEDEYALSGVVKETLAVYEELLLAGAKR